jgi:hypothetical protein
VLSTTVGVTSAHLRGFAIVMTARVIAEFLVHGYDLAIVMASPSERCGALPFVGIHSHNFAVVMAGSVCRLF